MINRGERKEWAVYAEIPNLSTNSNYFQESDHSELSNNTGKIN